MVQFRVYFEGRADRRPPRWVWLEQLGEQGYRLLKWRIKGGAG